MLSCTIPFDFSAHLVRAAADRLFGQLPQSRFCLFGDLTHNVAGRLELRYQADALPGPKRHGFDVAFSIGTRCIRSITNDRSNRLRCGDDLTFAWTLSGWWASSGLPGFHRLVAQNAMRGFWPSDIKQFLNEYRVVFACCKQQLAIARMNGSLSAGEKSRSNPNACCAQRQSGGEAAPVSNA